MKLIINIFEEDRTRIGNLHFIPEELKLEIASAISNGIPFERIGDEIADLKSNKFFTEEVRNGLGMALDVINKYR